MNIIGGEIQKYIQMQVMNKLIMVEVYWIDFNNLKLKLEILLVIYIKTIKMMIIV